MGYRRRFKKQLMKNLGMKLKGLRLVGKKVKLVSIIDEYRLEVK